MRSITFFQLNKIYRLSKLSEKIFPNIFLSQAIRNYSQRMYVDPLNILGNESKLQQLGSWMKLVGDEKQLKAFFCKIDNELTDNYLNDHFVFWLSRYVKNNPDCVMDFLIGRKTINSLCQHFISFCFNQKIYLDPDATLSSFNYHNYLSDLAVKHELEQLSLKKTFNIIGYGLDQGEYEKSIANYLLKKEKVKQVNIFGFDPYAKKVEGIDYLSLNDLQSGRFTFDLVIARWALHHVKPENRWGDFISCINSCSDKSNVIVIEHGILQKNSKGILKQLYFLLNATFDVVANIGLRPYYFKDSKPHIGANFFIEYLGKKDIDSIGSVHTNKSKHDIYNVGPRFPNQTIISMQIDNKSCQFK